MIFTEFFLLVLIYYKRSDFFINYQTLFQTHNILEVPSHQHQVKSTFKALQSAFYLL